jgi:hypothetical protein
MKRLQTLHVLRSGKTLTTHTGILDMHAKEGVDTRRIGDVQLPRQTSGLLGSFLFRRTLRTNFRFLSKQRTCQKGNEKYRKISFHNEKIYHKNHAK